MSDRLTVKSILRLVDDLKKAGMSQKEIESLPVYLGNDDELNGIHCGWCVDSIDTNDPTGFSQDYVEFINEDCCNIPLKKGKAVLIS